jgi:hypothetical protein
VGAWKGACAIDLDYLIDRLEEVLDHSTRVPFTSRVLIDEDEYLRLIDQMRISVPQEIKNARQIEAERDALLAAAQDQAEAMIAAGREKAAALTADHVVLAQAEERANEVLSDAYDEAAAIRADADAYALEVLERIAAQLEGFERTIRNGIRLLRAGDPVGRPPALEPEIVGDEPRTEQEAGNRPEVRRQPAPGAPREPR